MVAVDDSVGVVVVNWNGKDVLQRCLTSIVDNTEYEEAEIIVVDNDSDDGSKDLVRSSFPSVTLLASDTNLGYVGAENEAVRRTDHDMYLFMNNDTEVLTKGWLQPLVETATSADDIGIVGPKVILGDDYEVGSDSVHGGGTFHPIKGERRVSEDTEDYDEREDVDWVSGAQILVTREVFEDIGLFDEVYWPAFQEEVDLCFRANQAGYRVVYDPRSRVKHYQNETVGMDTEKFHVIRRYAMFYRWVNYPVSWLLLQPVREAKEAAGAVLTRTDRGVGLQDQAAARGVAQLKSYLWLVRNIDKLVSGRLKRRGGTSGMDAEFWMNRSPVEHRVDAVVQ